MWIWNVALNGAVLLLKFILLDQYFEETRTALTRQFHRGCGFVLLAGTVTYILTYLSFGVQYALIATGIDLGLSLTIIASYWLTRFQQHRQDSDLAFYGRMLYLYASVAVFFAIAVTAIDTAWFTPDHLSQSRPHHVQWV